MASGQFSIPFSAKFQKKLKSYEDDESRAMSGNDDDAYTVELYVYDMSKGLAKSMSPALLGKQIEGIWHTGVVAYGREYFFGSGGIESCRPGGTILGEPDRVEELGSSQVPYQLFLEYIFGLGESSYKPGAYDLLKHNCNNFSEEVSEFLCGRGIPKNILTLPDEVLNTALGETLSAVVNSLQLKNNETPTVSLCGYNNTISSYIPHEIRSSREDPELEALNSAIEEVRQNTQALEHRRNSLNEKLLKKERKEKKKEKREKKKKKHRSSSVVGEDQESSRRRRNQGESVRFALDVTEVPSPESPRQRRFSDPGSPEARLLPPPFPTKRPPLPPLEKKLIDLSPKSSLKSPSPTPAVAARNLSSSPSNSSRLSPNMDGDGLEDAPPREASPLPAAATQSGPESVVEEDLPPEVEREPPILFKDEVNVSSRGTFAELLPSLVASSSNISLSSYSSDDDDESSSSSTYTSSSSFVSTSSPSSLSCSSDSSSSSLASNIVDSNPNSARSSPFRTSVESLGSTDVSLEQVAARLTNQNDYVGNDNSRFVEFINHIHGSNLVRPTFQSPGKPPTISNQMVANSLYNNDYPEGEVVAGEKSNNKNNIPKIISRSICDLESHKVTSCNNSVKTVSLNNASLSYQVDLKCLDDQNIQQPKPKLRVNNEDVNITNNLDCNIKKHSDYSQKLPLESIGCVSVQNSVGYSDEKILNISEFDTKDPLNPVVSNLNFTNTNYSKLQNGNSSYLRQKFVPQRPQERPKSLDVPSAFFLVPARATSCEKIITAEIKIKNQEGPGKNQKLEFPKVQKSTEINSRKASSPITEIDTRKASSLCTEIDNRQASSLLTKIKTKTTSSPLTEIDTRKDTPFLTEIDTRKASALFTEIYNRQASSPLTKIKTRTTSSPLTEIGTSKVSSLLNKIVDRKASSPLTGIDNQKVSTLFTKVDTRNASSPLTGIDNQKASSILTEIDTTKTSSPLTGIDNRKTSSLLTGIDNQKASSLFTKIDTRKASSLLIKIDTRNASSPLTEVDNKKASSPLTEIDNRKASSPLTGIDNRKASSLLTEINTTKTSSPLTEIDTTKTSSPITEIDNRKTSSPLTGIDNRKDSSLLTEIDTTKTSSPLTGIDNRKTSSPLTGIDNQKASSLFTKIDTRKASSLLIEIDTRNASSPLTEVDNRKASSPLTEIENRKASSPLTGIDNRKASSLLTEIDTTKTSSPLTEIDTTKTSSPLTEIDNRKTSSPLTGIDNQKASSLLTAIDTTKASLLLTEINTRRISSLLPERNEEQKWVEITNKYLHSPWNLPGIRVARPNFLDLNGDSSKSSAAKKSFKEPWPETKKELFKTNDNSCNSSKTFEMKTTVPLSMKTLHKNEKFVLKTEDDGVETSAIKCLTPIDKESPVHKPPISPRIGNRMIVKSTEATDEAPSQKDSVTHVSKEELATQLPFRTSRFLEKIRKRKDSNQENTETVKPIECRPEKIESQNGPNNAFDNSVKSKFKSEYMLNKLSSAQKSVSISPDETSFHTPNYSPDDKDVTLRGTNVSNKFNFTLPSPDTEAFYTPTYSPDKKEFGTKCLNNSCEASAIAFDFVLPNLSNSTVSSPKEDFNATSISKLDFGTMNQPESSQIPSFAKKTITSNENFDMHGCTNYSDIHVNILNSNNEPCLPTDDQLAKNCVKQINENEEACTKYSKHDPCRNCSDKSSIEEPKCLAVAVATKQKSYPTPLALKDSISMMNSDEFSDHSTSLTNDVLKQNGSKTDLFSGVSTPMTFSDAEDKSEKHSMATEFRLEKIHPPPSVIGQIPESTNVDKNIENLKKKVIPSRLPPSYEAAIANTPSGNSNSSFETSESDVSLSRSSTQSSVDSTMSFGSSYYTLYIVDHNFRPKTPEEAIFSPENSPPPEDIIRSSSTSSVDSFRTISPGPEYFEENTRTFRAMRGLSLGSSTESLLTCFSRSQSMGSTSTLQNSRHSNSPTLAKVGRRFPIAGNCQISKEDCKFSRRNSSFTTTDTLRSLPVSPSRTFSSLPARSNSLGSFHSVIRRYPNVTSPFGSISTFDLASCSHSPTPQPSFSRHPNRPPSTDSPILFDSPGGSQHSLLLFRPLPRYSARSVSPEPEPAVLCYLGPARPFEQSLVFASILQETVADFDGFVNVVAEMLSPDEQRHMEELRAYVVEDEGSWALGEDFNMLFARIFHDPSIPDDARRHLLRIMAAAALKDDVILMLHQDRKEHTIMNFANKIESLRPDIQEALALFFCNMFEHLSPSEWLLYISEWAEGSQQISNIRVTTKVAVNALLHQNPKVQEYGTALMYNLGTKEVKTVVFDDVAPELAMAILQFFGNNPPEEYIWRVLTALCRFCYASTEVPALIKMIGPDPNTYKGMSERIDLVLEEINSKLSKVRGF